MDHEYRRRSSDDTNFIRKNWMILLSFTTFVSGYAILTASVRNHHEIDEARCTQYSKDIQQSKEDIAVLKEIVKAIPRIEDKVDGIYSAVIKIPGKVEDLRLHKK